MKIYTYVLAIIIFSISLNAQVEKPSIHGSLRAGGYYFKNLADSSNIPPSGYLLSGRVNFRWGELSIPVVVNVNDQGLTYNKPFSRIGLSPKYKWITLHLGHRNLHYSTFVLDRRTIFGIGGEINLGKLRLGYMKGNFTNYYNELSSYNAVPIFDRKGWAGKIGYGTSKNFFDIVISTAKDDSLSVYKEVPKDSVFINPKQNLAIGFKSQFTFSKSLSIEFDGAISSTTQDLTHEPISDYANEPVIGSLLSGYNFNETSHADYAGQVKLNYLSGAFFSNIMYRRVMPGFESFGVRYMIKDLETITFNPGYSFNRGQTTIGASLGIMRNNLNQFKIAKTNRLIGSVNLFSKLNDNWTTYAQYSNYSLTQQVIRDEFSYDSLLVNQISHQVSIIPTYTMKSGSNQYQVSANLIYQINEDQSATEVSNQSNTYTNLGLSFSLRNINNGWTYRLAPRYFSYSSDFFESKRSSLLFTVRKDSKKSKTSFFTTIGLSQVSNNSDSYLEYHLNSRLEYEATKGLKIGGQLATYKNFRSEGARNEIRTEVFAQLRF